jgi:hypothetical protein
MAVRQIPAREFSKKRQTILLLLGEKAGMREVVKPKSDGARLLIARSLAMTEIKLGRTPHSALSIPHLNGSFPEFILGWTIGAIGV